MSAPISGTFDLSLAGAFAKLPHDVTPVEITEATAELQPSSTPVKGRGPKGAFTPPQSDVNLVYVLNSLKLALAPEEDLLPPVL